MQDVGQTGDVLLAKLAHVDQADAAGRQLDLGKLAIHRLLRAGHDDRLDARIRRGGVGLRGNRPARQERKQKRRRDRRHASALVHWLNTSCGRPRDTRSGRRKGSDVLRQARTDLAGGARAL